MSNQAEPGTFGSVAPERARFGRQAGTPEPGMAAEPGALAENDPRITGIYPAHHGRPVSWVAVSIIVTGFVVGGFALVFGPTWWLFWVGLGMAVVGVLLATATNVFADWY